MTLMMMVMMVAVVTGRWGWWKVFPAQRIILDEVVLEGGPEDWVIFGRAMMGHKGLLLKEQAKAQWLESQSLPRKQRVEREITHEQKAGRGNWSRREFGARPKKAVDLVHWQWRPSVLCGVNGNREL